MANKGKAFDRKCQLWGWVLFITSSVFYGVASIRTGDILGILGSLFFFVACLVFLIPFFFSAGDFSDGDS